MSTSSKKNYVLARLLLVVLGLGMFFICYAQMRSLYAEGSDVRKKEVALQEIKRLLVITIQYSKTHPLPSAENVWQEFGFRSPSLDPWGTPYQIKIKSNSVLWCSAGPDRHFATQDDIFFRIPMNNTPVPDSVEPPPPSAAPAASAQ